MQRRCAIFIFFVNIRPAVNQAFCFGNIYRQISPDAKAANGYRRKQFAADDGGEKPPIMHRVRMKVRSLSILHSVRFAEYGKLAPSHIINPTLHKSVKDNLFSSFPRRREVNCQSGSGFIHAPKINMVGHRLHWAMSKESFKPMIARLASYLKRGRIFTHLQKEGWTALQMLRHFPLRSILKIALALDQRANGYSCATELIMGRFLRLSSQTTLPLIPVKMVKPKLKFALFVCRGRILTPQKIKRAGRLCNIAIPANGHTEIALALIKARADDSRKR